jgi:2'-hydroxyisoflavone reductase
MAEMIAGVRAVLPGSLDVRFHWLPAEFLAEQQVRGWSGPESLPVWIPAREGNDGWGRVGIQRALDAGLTYRSLADTTQSVLEYFPSYQAGLDPERRARGMAAGLTEEKERQVLEAWRARGGR